MTDRQHLRDSIQTLAWTAMFIGVALAVVAANVALWRLNRIEERIEAADKPAQEPRP